jgi:UDP-N-acetylmuramate dehydrogenase
MKIASNFSLKPYNTFGFESTAQYWAEFSSLDELRDLYTQNKWKDTPKYLLSGGSNVLLPDRVEGLVLHPAIEGIELVADEENAVTLKVGAGVDWDEFVAYTVSHGWNGLENLSYIPGMVGTSPIQNIGAYGVEVKDTIVQVAYLHTETLDEKVLSNQECQFGYRDSIFKNQLKGKAVITHVWFQLKKTGDVNMGYGHLRNAVKALGEPSPARVREAVIQIRRAKLPEPEELGSAGSFFKNPYVSTRQLEELLRHNEHMPHYPISEQTHKIPAGWLIDQCSWKGYRHGDAGVHKQQALVLVNYGKATRNDILDLARQIQQSVKQKFGIELHREVNLLP